MFTLALHSAVEKNDYKLVQESIETLLQKEICINLVDQEGYTPLHVASKNGFKDIVTLLLKKGANINISISDNVETPLSLAIKNRHEDVVMLLLEKGADINQRLPKGYAPLHCAVKVKHLKIIKMLVQQGADINLRDVAHGYSPLHLAVIYYNEESQSEIMLTSVIQDEYKLFNFYEPFMIKSKSDKATQNTLALYVSIIKYLLENGADINVRNWDEESPLHCAARHNQISLIKLLIEQGADSSLESSDGDTPIDLVTDDKCLYNFIKYIAFYNQTIKRSGKYHYGIWAECRNELQKMKDSIFDNSNISWYTFLTQNDENHLEAYLCNDNIRKQLEIEEYKINFPIYQSMIEIQIEKGEKRYSLTQDVINYFYLELPVEDCWRRILYYLNTSDLEYFVNVIYNKLK